MKKTLRIAIALAGAGAVLSAAEGKWTPEQVLRLDPAVLKKEGLEIEPGKLWDPAQQSGLLAGAVSLGGCSAAFVSETGLLATNHHCLFSVVQQHSTPGRDLISNGFLAASPTEELPGRALRVAVPRSFRDVTRQILEAVPAGADDLVRRKAVEARGNELVARCEEQPGMRCQVAAFDGGVQYMLIEARELKDIRLVYAPPRAVGEYGGEVDNFGWPRHTGDFSIARVYENGQPYRPRFFFPVSTRGVAPGDFVMVLGYPGMTFRSLTAAEMAERRDLFYPRRIELYGEWIRILEESGRKSREGEILVAATLKSLLNSYKNAQGQIAGFRRGNLLEKAQAAEAEVVRWAAGRPEFKEALAARQELAEMVAAQRLSWERDFLLEAMPQGARALAWANTVVKAAQERRKPDAERESGYMDRDRDRLRDRLEREQKSYFEPADRALLAAFLARLEPTGGEPVATLYARTKVTVLEERMKMLEESVEQMRARRDPMLELAFRLSGAVEELRLRRDRQRGAVSRLRPAWRKAVAAHAGRPLAPDANGTLRVSFAHVKGYEPRDGMIYKAQTTLAGVIEKHTGEEPFRCPEPVLAAARAGRTGRWKDARLGEVPVNFLSDADTSGGNSGSPTVNGRGELVGLNFDRVWENVANDFGYNPAVARNVNVDIRYLLWILEEIQGADKLLGELGVRGK